MIRKKWWEKKAVEGSHQWCVIRVEDFVVHRPDMWAARYINVYKPCHLSNLPTGSHLLNKNLTKHEAQALCKLLNLQGVES